MTKEVVIKLKGIQLGMEEEFLTVCVPGNYHLANGKHFIQYEEKSEEKVITKNILKISPASVVLTRSAQQATRHSQMFFELNETTRTDYPTPYGNLPLDIKTNKITVNEASNIIEVTLEYSLFSNDAQLSDNVLSIIVEAVKD